MDYLNEKLGVTPTYTYLTGGSQGGLITTLALERNPDVFDGGLSLCGPCGNFEKQLNYYGDFRLVFDYFFPGVLPGNISDIPPDLITDWDSYKIAIIETLMNNPVKTQKLLSVTKAPYDPNDLTTIGETVVNTL